MTASTTPTAPTRLKRTAKRAAANAVAPADKTPEAPPAAIAPSAAAEAKRKHPKLVRDSFTIPKSEYAVLESLKLRAVALAQPAKKSELLRAGIAALAAMSDKAFLAKLAQVPSLKTGRPSGVARGID